MAAWRASKGVDELMRTFRFSERAIIRTVYPHFYHKTDKYGRPVYYELLGQVGSSRSAVPARGAAAAWEGCEIVRGTPAAASRACVPRC